MKLSKKMKRTLAKELILALVSITISFLLVYTVFSELGFISGLAESQTLFVYIGSSAVFVFYRLIYFIKVELKGPKGK